jgi:D-aspartate ligase
MRRQGKAPGVVVLGSDFKALGVVRSLGRRGIPSVVIDQVPRSAWFSRYVTRRLKWPGPMEGEEFLAFLLQIAKEYHVEHWVLFALQDEVVELVARHHEALSQVYQLVPPPWDVVQWANDKRLTYRMAEEQGVPYPKTWYPANAAELERLPITFPVIIKPAISVHLQYAVRLKALPASTMAELLEHYRQATSIISPDEVMIQEIIPGTGETQFSVAAFCQDGEALLKMTARRTRQYPIDYGLGSSFVEALEVPEIIAPAEKLLRFMRISGMVEVEFKLDRRDNQYKLLDINIRPWGWHTLCEACGLDFSYIQYCAVLGQAPERSTPRYGAHWVRFITDLPAGRQEIRAGLTTRRAYLRSLLGKTVFSVFAWRDPLPAIGDSASVFKRALHLRQHKGASG